jgi:hypothetical protein
MSNILQDDRVKWLRQRVVLSLEISTDSFDEYFTDSLERARSAGIARDQLFEYLSKKNGAGTSIFFSSNTWNEDVESIKYLLKFIFKS